MAKDKSVDRAVLLFAAFCLSMSSGFLSGRMLSLDSTGFSLQEDKRPAVPTVSIEGIRNGMLHGSIIGSARVFIGDEYFVQSGVFVMDASSLFTNEILLVVPDGAEFVASKRGKKYYPVFSSAGENITPQNRIYFSSTEEAEKSGYVR